MLKKVAIFILNLRCTLHYLLFSAGNCLFCILRFLKLIHYHPFQNETVKKILIIRPDRIGDLILSLPAIHAIRNRFPNAKISVLINPDYKAILYSNPDIDSIVYIERGTYLDFAKWTRLRNILLKEKFDMAIALHSTLFSHILCFISSAEFRIGSNRDGSGFLLTNCIGDIRDKNKHEIDACLDIVESIGCYSHGKKPELYIHKEAEKDTKNIFKSLDIEEKTGFIVVHPGSRDVIYRWNKNKFAGLCDKIINEFSLPVILIGDKKEKRLTGYIASKMKNKAVNLAGKLDLYQLIALISNAKLFIGHSTGPMHIAWSMNIPTIAIFGSVYPRHFYKRWQPLGNKSAVIKKDVECKTCFPWLCKNRICLDKISVEDVFEKIGKILR